MPLAAIENQERHRNLYLFLQSRFKKAQEDEARGKWDRIKLGIDKWELRESYPEAK